MYTIDRKQWVDARQLSNPHNFEQDTLSDVGIKSTIWVLNVQETSQHDACAYRQHEKPRQKNIHIRLYTWDNNFSTLLYSCKEWI